MSSLIINHHVHLEVCISQRSSGLPENIIYCTKKKKKSTMPLTISETTATKMLWMIQAAIMDFRLAFIKLQMLPLKNICSYTDAVCGLKTNQKNKNPTKRYILLQHANQIPAAKFKGFNIKMNLLSWWKHKGCIIIEKTICHHDCQTQTLSILTAGKCWQCSQYCQDKKAINKKKTFLKKKII